MGFLTYWSDSTVHCATLGDLTITGTVSASQTDLSFPLTSSDGAATVAVDFGDGTNTNVAATGGTYDGVTPWTASATYAAAGTYTIKITVTMASGNTELKHYTAVIS